MHMADALLSPAVGVTMWGVSAATITYCSKKIRMDMDDRKIPLMGVLGAFIFAAQMINFTIPVTGSSGHLGGVLILSILLGPYAAFLTIASVLVVQALFFADGGLLALGCNIFNLGFLPAFIAYPFIYKKIAGNTPSPAKIPVASMAAAAIGLQMGSLGVVVETVLSGISSLPFQVFVVFMQPIHLVIGIVEGMITASVISFVYNARPEIFQNAMDAPATAAHPFRAVAFGFLAAAFLTGGVLSWFASGHPDGLEWSIAAVTGKKNPTSQVGELHTTLAALQEKLSFLPDYSFKKASDMQAATAASLEQQPEKMEAKGKKLGTTLSGIVGGTLTLGVSFIIGSLLKRRGRIERNVAETGG